MSIRMVPEQATQMAALQAGAADIIPADVTVIDQIRSAGARVIFSPESTVIWINAWNCNPESPQTQGKDLQGRPLMCADQRVRYALDYAIDKEAIQQFFGGPEVFQIKGTAAVSPSGLGYQPGLDPFPYDPEKARQLLAEAGYPNGEGFNYGEPFQVWTWDAGATAPRIPELAQLICSMWKAELNITCEINVGEEVSIKDKQYAGQIPGQYLIRSNEHDFDVGSKFKGRFGTPTGSYISYDPEIHTLVDKALATIGSQEERAQVYYDMHKATYDAHWDFTPGYLNAPYGVTNEIATWEPWPMKVHPSALWTIRWK
jgi:peptide/nickel transport system substrate-binding protein